MAVEIADRSRSGPGEAVHELGCTRLGPLILNANKAGDFYRSNQTSSIRAPFEMLLTMIVSPFT